MSNMRILADGLDKLYHLCSLANIGELFKHETGPILARFGKSCDEWAGPNGWMEASIFSQLLKLAGPIAGLFTKQIVGIFHKVLGPETKDDFPPEMQLKMLLLLSEQMLSCSRTMDSQGQFHVYSQSVIKRESFHNRKTSSKLIN